jgi:fructose-bisphosphate aldolase class II
MPVPDFNTYSSILDRALAGHYALPAVNVTSLATANAVLRGLAESNADIIQISTGGGAFASGTSLKDPALGAISIAEHVRRAAERYRISVALHTDHFLKDKLDPRSYLAIAETEMAERVKQAASDLRASDKTMFAS